MSVQTQKGNTQMGDVSGKTVWVVLGRPLDAADTDVLFVASTSEKTAAAINRAEEVKMWGEVWAQAMTVDSFISPSTEALADGQ